MEADADGIPCNPWVVQVEEGIPLNPDYVQMCSLASSDGSWTCGTTQTENEYDITYANEMSFQRGTYSFKIGEISKITNRIRLVLTDNGSDKLLRHAPHRYCSFDIFITIWSMAVVSLRRVYLSRYVTTLLTGVAPTNIRWLKKLPRAESR